MGKRLILAAFVCVVGTSVAVFATGCMATADTSSETPEELQSCDGDCVQPPLRRADLVEHLREHQDRILARDDYRDRIPPPISNVIYGPLPDGYHRGGPLVENADGEVYDGELNWHLVEFEDVETDGAEHDTLRGRDVSGAHCFFAQRPNRHTSIFALLVMHHPHRGDVLYFGGPDQHVTRIDTVPVTNRHPSRIRIASDEMRCVFRHDQNQLGAVIVPFEYVDAGDSDDPQYAVLKVTVGTERRDTGETKTVRRTTGLRNDRVVEVEVPAGRYPRPQIEAVGAYPSVYEAMVAAEEEIVPGDFRLRPEFVYPRLPWQSYLDTGHEEFCPKQVECYTPRKHLDKDDLPDFDAEQREEAEQQRTSE